MRKLYIDFASLEGCCRVDVVHTFPRISGKTVTKEEWFNTLYDYLGCNLIAFAHSSEENYGPCTPKSFATWLRRKGEKVTEVKHEHVTLYTCALSKKFMEELDAYKNKKEEELQAEYNRRNNAD
jgi:hypothetical protein